MSNLYDTIKEKRVVISNVTDRLWGTDDLEQIAFRNRLFPEGKPSVYRFVFRMRGYLVCSIVKRIVIVIANKIRRASLRE